MALFESISSNPCLILLGEPGIGKGKYASEPVLRFITNGEERARAYKCRWGYRTNCNATHIDVYTDAIHDPPMT